MAGHVHLQYKGKGSLLTSSSHWAELNTKKIRVNEDNIRKVQFAVNTKNAEVWEEKLKKCKNESEKEILNQEVH